MHVPRQRRPLLGAHPGDLGIVAAPQGVRLALRRLPLPVGRGGPLAQGADQLMAGAHHPAEQERHERAEQHDPEGHEVERGELLMTQPHRQVLPRRGREGDQRERRPVQQQASAQAETVQSDRRGRQREGADPPGRGDHQVQHRLRPTRGHEPQRADREGEHQAHHQVEPVHRHQRIGRIVRELDQQLAEDDQEQEQAHDEAEERLRAGGRPGTRGPHRRGDGSGGGGRGHGNSVGSAAGRADPPNGRCRAEEAGAVGSAVRSGSERPSADARGPACARGSCHDLDLHPLSPARTRPGDAAPAGRDRCRRLPPAAAGPAAPQLLVATAGHPRRVRGGVRGDAAADVRGDPGAVPGAAGGGAQRRAARPAEPDRPAAHARHARADAARGAGGHARRLRPGRDRPLGGRPLPLGSDGPGRAGGAAAVSGGERRREPGAGPRGDRGAAADPPRRARLGDRARARPAAGGRGGVRVPGAADAGRGHLAAPAAAGHRAARAAVRAGARLRTAGPGRDRALRPAHGSARLEDGRHRDPGAAARGEQLDPLRDRAAGARSSRAGRGDRLRVPARRRSHPAVHRRHLVVVLPP